MPRRKSLRVQYAFYLSSIPRHIQPLSPAMEGEGMMMRILAALLALPGLAASPGATSARLATPRLRIFRHFQPPSPAMEGEGMMMRILAALLALPGLAGAPVPAASEGEEKRLYFFFSEKTPSAPETAQAIAAFLAKAPAAGIALRPALLVEDWSTFLKVDAASPLYQTIRQLGKGIPIQIQIYDEEALQLVEAWKITRLPAVVLVAKGRAHVLQGAVAGLEELLECSR